MTFRSLLASRTPSLSTDPFMALHRALNGSFDDLWRTGPTALMDTAAMTISLDVREDEKAFHVSADLPGLSEKEIEVSFDDGVLTLRGEKKVERDEKKDTWHIVERSTGSFARRLALSTAIDAQKIEARFEKGVLHVMLPKLEQAQSTAHKIEIKTH